MVTNRSAPRKFTKTSSMEKVKKWTLLNNEKNLHIFPVDFQMNNTFMKFFSSDRMI